MQKNGAHQLLCEHGWLAEQPAELQDLVLDRSILRTCYDGELISSMGDPPGGVHALIDGLVKLFFDTAAGDELLLKIFRPGEWFGIISMFDQLPLPHHARVSGGATILTLPRTGFDEIVRQQPLFLKNFALVMADNMRFSMERLVDISTLDPARRLAKLLLRVGASLDGTDTGDEPIDLSQAEMCDLINASRATINKLLQEWQAAGWIEYSYRNIRILPPRALNTVLNG